MRYALISKLALGCAGICLCGSVVGMGLANYATSGSFDFYKQQHISEWEPQPAQSAALDSNDLVFASDRRTGTDGAAAGEIAASFDR